MKRLLLVIVMFSLPAGCARIAPTGKDGVAASEEAPVTVPAQAVAAKPPPAARTVEEFDTTTAEQRQEAAAPASAARVLGRTIASLGTPAEPGFWLKTPLVTAEGPGIVTNPANGKSAAVTLIPIEGPKTAGSRMSLAALRLIGAGLGTLTEVEVSLPG